MSNKNIIRLTVGMIATNCWIYPFSKNEFSQNEAAVIDPGDEAQNIISALEKNALALKYILLTHGHFDHIAALPQLKERYENAEIAIHEKDGFYLGENAYTEHRMSIMSAMGGDFIDAIWPSSKSGIPSAGRLLKEGDMVESLTVLHLPGHTQGSAAFWDKENKILFTGDTLFKNGYGRTDLQGGDEKEIMKSLRRLFEMDKGIRVYPGHGESTTIGEEIF